MPDSRHPPFVPGSLTSPRQLQRWLDVNPQGGALKRIEKYVTVPSFSIAVTWLGYSQIVGEYHFAATKNFSLKSFTPPSNPDHTCCISYVNSDNTVVRYRLWSSSGELIYGEIPIYNGQLIKKNFRVEIWSTNVATVNLTADVQIYTSVRGDIDYRYGNDSVLVSAGVLCQGQGSIYDIGVIAANPPPAVTKFWFNPLSGIVSAVGLLTSWTDSIAGSILLPSAFPDVVSYQNAPVRYLVIVNGGSTLTGNTVAGAHHLFFNFQVGINLLTTSGTILTYGSGGTVIKLKKVLTHFTVEVNGVTVITTSNFLSTYSNDGDPNWFLFSLYTGVADGTILNVYNQLTKELVETGTSITGVDVATTNFILGDAAGNVNHSLMAMVAYSGIQLAVDLTAVQDYFQSLFTFSFPLTWGTCAAPTLNS